MGEIFQECLSADSVLVPKREPVYIQVILSYGIKISKIQKQKENIIYNFTTERKPFSTIWGTIFQLTS